MLKIVYYKKGTIWYKKEYFVPYGTTPEQAAKYIEEQAGTIREASSGEFLYDTFNHLKPTDLAIPTDTTEIENDRGDKMWNNMPSEDSEYDKTRGVTHELPLYIVSYNFADNNIRPNYLVAYYGKRDLAIGLFNEFWREDIKENDYSLYASIDWSLGSGADETISDAAEQELYENALTVFEEFKKHGLNPQGNSYTINKVELTVRTHSNGDHIVLEKIRQSETDNQD